MPAPRSDIGTAAVPLDGRAREDAFNPSTEPCCGLALGLPPPTPPMTSKEQQTTTQSELPLVQEPSLQEELNDEIPDFGNENAESPKAATPPRKSAAQKPQMTKRRAQKIAGGRDR